LRATRAYITGFGTTGLLIAAAFVSLFVMSAYVAFNGFPGQDVQDPIGSVLLQERQASVEVPKVSIDAPTHAVTQTSVVRGHHHTAAQRGGGPVATTNVPLKNRVSTQAPAQTQAPATSTGTAHSTTPQLPATPETPSVSLPEVELPGVQTPTQVQLPVDTDGVTDGVSNTVNNLLSSGK
jgi:hypothetical protein